MGWVNHGLGLGRIFELRGPHAHIAPPMRLLLESARTLMIVAALSIHKRTFLSRPEWKTIPWSLGPLQKSSMQQLLDILAEVPYMLEKKDAAASFTIDRKEFSGCLAASKDKIIDLLHDLHSWR